MKKNCCKENIKENKDIIPEFSSGSSTHVVSKQPQQASKTLKQVQGLSNRNITGFTLIELLVVVLIIGILAAIALPQYQKAVEKSRLAEALQNAKLIEECFNWYILEHGLPSSGFVELKDMNCPIELNLGQWNASDKTYTSENFEYHSARCGQRECESEICRDSFDKATYTLLLRTNEGKSCWTQTTDIGRYICNGLRNQGWTYTDSEL